MTMVCWIIAENGAIRSTQGNHPLSYAPRLPLAIKCRAGIPLPCYGFNIAGWFYWRPWNCYTEYTLIYLSTGSPGNRRRSLV